MATELIIKSWCDECLEAGVNTPGELVTVNVTGTPAFDLEVCPEHGGPLAAVVAHLAAYGRSPGKTLPMTPAGASKAVRPNQAAGTGGSCPECGHSASTRAALRTHLRKMHDKSLADVGLAEARFTCDECGAKFDAGQGIASHVRAAHGTGAKQSA